MALSVFLRFLFYYPYDQNIFFYRKISSVTSLAGVRGMRISKGDDTTPVGNDRIY